MHWITHLKLEPELYFGFVYMITNKQNNKKYIGCKQYRFTRTIKRTIRIKRRVITKPSNWETYTGSSTELNLDIAKLGKENFEFRILSQHKTKSLLKYHEAKTIFDHDALLLRDNNGNRMYYNKMVGRCSYLANNK